ncbi:sigma factor-like helix-turn-helix DNA-binding protein [Haloferax sp. ATB1]|uniref:sigma-70 region 4 domain-containing protein n=1 Tax=Haloferax sp. ATB1 TaxID=1508454 RepID=UPI0005B1E4E1|nr:sigma-70 region 4 domain-containing protein [Haloferax sp. ATB1]
MSAQTNLGTFTAGLSPAETDAYLAVDEGDETPTEFARRTGRDPSTVRTLLYRARRKLDKRGAA